MKQSDSIHASTASLLLLGAVFACAEPGVEGDEAGLVDETGGSLCNNGVLEADEECDEGVHNGDDADCTSTCTLARCGDGLVHEDREQCDDGNQLSGDGCSDKCEDEHFYAFVSSILFGPGLGGFGGADAHCQAMAWKAGLPGTYYAWISSIDRTPAQRFTRSMQPYWTVTQVKIADDWNDLTDGTLDAPINITELGEIVELGEVWTGTHPDGTGPLDTCAAWTSSQATATLGRTDQVDGGWSTNSTTGCSAQRRIYCFRQ